MTSDEPPETDPPPQRPEEGYLPNLSPEQYKARLVRYLYILMRLVFFGLIAAGVYWFASALGGLLVPLLASLIIAFLLNPFVRQLQQRGISRRLAILICLSAGAVVLGLAAVFLIPTLIGKLSTLINELPTVLEQVRTEWLPWIEERVGTVVPATEEQAANSVGGGLATSFPKLAERVGAWTLGAASKTSRLLIGTFNFLLIPVFTYYFLRKMEGAKQTIADLLPVRRREYTLTLLDRMNRAIGKWFRGQIQLALIVGLLYSAGLALAFALAGLDFKLGLAIGIVAGVTNIIPYVGMLIAIVLSTLVVLLEWPGWSGVLGVAGVFVVNNILEGYVLGPKILGESVGLHPVAVIILALIGGQLAGLMGILLIIPLAGAIQVIRPDLMAIYRETTFYRGDAAGVGDDND